MVVAAVAVVTLAGCSSTTSPTAGSASSSASASASATTVAAAARGTEAPIDTVPWSQVGAGWMLATWSEVPGGYGGEEPKPGEPSYQTATTTLYLVDPQGGRYPITTFPPPGDTGVSPGLVDWSGDGTRALMYAQGSDDGTVIEVDLHTGKQTSFTVDGFDVTPGYTKPMGKAVLLLKDNDVDSPASLRRVDLTGKPQLTYPVDKLASEFNAAYLSNPEGTQLVLGMKSGLALMGNDGSVGKPLPIEGGGTCRPLRWFDADAKTALAQCYGADFATRLWLVPVDGAAPSPLTAANTGQSGPDLADENAWRLPQGTYVQASGACGHRYLAKLDDDGHTTAVSVPNVAEKSSVVVLGVNGGHLNLLATVSCGTGESLLDFDPAANTSTVLLGPPVNGGGVIAALPYSGFD